MAYLDKLREMVLLMLEQRREGGDMIMLSRLVNNINKVGKDDLC